MKCQELVKEKVELENENKELKKKIHILTESQMNLENTIGKFGEENPRLKELLKECKDIIEWYKADCGYKDLPTESVLTKIEEALK